MDLRKNARRKLILDGLLVFIITTTPLLFYAHKYVPENLTNTSFLGIDFTSNGFEDVSTAFYYYFKKIVPLVLLIIWFVTCKQWWYHAILIPMAMYSFQLYTILVNTSISVDNNEIMYILMVIVVVVPIVYFVRIKLVDKYVHGIDLEAMNEELGILKEKEELRKERQKLEQQQRILEQ